MINLPSQQKPQKAQKAMKKFGDLLVEEKAITSEQLNQALEEQKKKRRKTWRNS